MYELWSKGESGVKENLINRKTYKAIKRMDRQEMEEFLARVYKNGFKDGTDAGNMADFRIKLSQVLNRTKGVGTVLYDRIMQNAKEMEQ